MKTHQRDRSVAVGQSLYIGSLSSTKLLFGRLEEHQFITSKLHPKNGKLITDIHKEIVRRDKPLVTIKMYQYAKSIERKLIYKLKEFGITLKELE